MPNFPGSDNALPGVYTNVETLSSGVSAPTGVRLAVIMGEGSRRETIVGSASGYGNDGFNSTYTSTTGRDGRHFMLSNAPIVSNRTTLFKNGIPLVGIEASITSSPFSANYDYRIDITNGHIELQQANLVDQGGRYYKAGTLNTGNGTISNPTLVDVNAPTETWTVRCTAVRRDGYGVIVPQSEQFIATGSVSGILLDGYGNTVIWRADGVTVANTVLSFAINDGVIPFREGDVFTINVKGGVLLPGDSLTATYIAETDINAPTFFTDMDALTQQCGFASLDNRLSLGGQLAFSNTPPGIWTNQCAPSVPRRLSYTLDTSFPASPSTEDFAFPLPINVQPDYNSNINFFVTDPTTGVETQILPNKVAFYNSTFATTPATFINGYTYSYTVIEVPAIVKSGSDGYIQTLGGSDGTLYSASVLFGQDDLINRTVKIFNTTNPANTGTFTIVSVDNGILTITGATFVTESNVSFEIIDNTSGVTSTEVLFTSDLAQNAGTSIRATIVDSKDADFFDAGWIAAYEAIEVLDIDIVVPLPSQTISTIFQNGATHCRSMSNIKNKKERVLFIGAISGLTPNNVIGTTNAAVEDIGILEGIQGDSTTEILAGNVEDLANYGVQSAYGSTYRVVYFYPDQIVVQIGSDRQKIDGFFIAAAAAGYLTGIPNISLPLTRKTVSGFTILNDKLYRPIVQEQIVAAGITLLQPVTGGGVVVRGQTTTNSGFLEEREISIVFIRDRIAKDLRSAMLGFIGEVDSTTTQVNIANRASSVLNGFVGRGLITIYKDLKVERDKVDPTQWNITVKVQPVYPINFVYIRVSVGLLE